MVCCRPQKIKQQTSFIKKASHPPQARSYRVTFPPCVRAEFVSERITAILISFEESDLVTSRESHHF
jgi:hypothetical protein